MGMRRVFLTILVVLAALPGIATAQTLVSDEVTMELARVVSVSQQKNERIPGLDVSRDTQELEATILTGAEKGRTITFENDFTQLKQGDTFYVRHTANALDNTNFYSVADPYRLPVLLVCVVVFLGLLFYFGGRQGVRGFASLCGSLVLIFFALIPGILHGYDPVTLSVLIAGAMIIVGSYITHGFNKTTSAAVLGMLLTVVLTGIGGYIAVYAAHLSGFSSEESTYLTMNSKGTLNLVGLLYAGIMIGLLGVLYDMAIGQAVAVEELFRAGKHMTRSEIYARGIRIGREHIGALVNTLAIAYVGASLPLLLLVQTSTYGVLFMLNSEIFATEIIRVLIGSIGLVLTVPITTFIASRMLSPTDRPTSEHTHSHVH